MPRLQQKLIDDALLTVSIRPIFFLLLGKEHLATKIAVRRDWCECMWLDKGRCREHETKVALLAPPKRLERGSPYMYLATPGPPGPSRRQPPHHGLLIAPAAPIRLSTTTGASPLPSSSLLQVALFPSYSSRLSPFPELSQQA